MNEQYNCKIEYLWLDGYSTPNIRSKTKYCTIPSVAEGAVGITDIPEWGFDGSSTKQANGNSSDCVLKPASIYRNSVDHIANVNSYIVLCEVFNTDGTPHESNTRYHLRQTLSENPELNMWFGIEQEYTVIDQKTNRPFNWPDMGYPSPQGRYYCGVGGDVVAVRDLVHEHAACSIMAGVPLCGTNAEVMLSQWEYQIGPSDALQVCDYLWITRYMLEILAEQKGISISLDPKPVVGDWNGSGAHINFSTEYMRENSDKKYIETVCKTLEEAHIIHISNYGIGNDERLTGEHETQCINKFSWGESDRGASIRIPPSTAKEYKGYIEDRRPAANIDPYRAVECLVKTVGVATDNYLSVMSDG